MQGCEHRSYLEHALLPHQWLGGVRGRGRPGGNLQRAHAAGQPKPQSSHSCCRSDAMHALGSTALGSCMPIRQVMLLSILSHWPMDLIARLVRMAMAAGCYI